MLIASAHPQSLGSADSRLRFGEEPKAPGAWRGRRVLLLDAKVAFELSFWCGSCQFLFQRDYGANETMSYEGLENRLADGLDNLDDEVVGQFAELLPAGTYLPLLLRVEPRLIHPSGAGDYFAEEQVATWGVSSFWGLPEYPRTPYYRTFDTKVDDESHLFEFVVPMVPPTWNDSSKVAEHAEQLLHSSSPTAVAISTLDVCAPAMDLSNDYYTHWGLTHFLLDGHHKMHAAADNGAPLRLLSFLSVDASLATADKVARIPDIRAASPTKRDINNARSG